jgi:methionine synthase I (cobalamin-dependent)
MTALLDVLRGGRVLLMDGAMGTELQNVGLRPDENSATWNTLHPAKVEAVHRAYRTAGADVLLSNTFLINRLNYPPKSICEGRRPPIAMLWQKGLERMGWAPAYRLAAVGPVAGEAAGREFDDWKRFFVLDRCLFHDGGPESCRCPHGILLETCSTPRVRFALERLRQSSELPLLLSLAFYRDPRGRLITASGHSPEWFARRASAYGADALGANCGKDVGMDEMIEIIRRYRQETDLPVFARPNAGTPVRRGDRWAYPRRPQVMADRMPELLEAGVCMVGGCCGTTPEHIAAFRKVVDAWNASHLSAIQQAR